MYLLRRLDLELRISILSSEKKDIKITNHVYQPKHEILPKKEAEEVLKKYNTKPSQLPYILINDKGLED
ncbi:MAG TPA: DNA-directed RNA polymerase subunit RpoH/Rpb5 C-terminal domain-containing protein, partial [Nitrososphaeraceae archaeon]